MYREDEKGWREKMWKRDLKYQKLGKGSMKKMRKNWLNLKKYKSSIKMSF